MKKVGGRLLWSALTLTPTPLPQRPRPDGALKPVERAERPPTSDGALKARALNANEVDATNIKIACTNIVPILARLDCDKSYVAPSGQGVML